jgi:hypothetical protein
MSNTQTFRNIVDVTSKEGIFVEAGSLWRLTGENDLTLVDDDQHVTCKTGPDFRKSN